MRRRPSFATVVALLALFVALGGPAQAAKFVDGKLRRNSVTSATVKDRSLKLRDLARRTVLELQTPRDGSVTAAKLAPGAVTSVAIADRAVGSGDVAIGAITGTHVADGSLTARELGRFYGRFQLAQPIDELLPRECWTGAPVGLAAERAGVDISKDVVLVTPDATWPQKQLSLTVKVEAAQAQRGRFVLSACNVSALKTAAFTPSFSYLIIDVP